MAWLFHERKKRRSGAGGGSLFCSGLEVEADGGFEAGGKAADRVGDSGRRHVVVMARRITVQGDVLVLVDGRPLGISVSNSRPTAMASGAAPSTKAAGRAGATLARVSQEWLSGGCNRPV